jgi:hypothetical protein
MTEAERSRDLVDLLLVSIERLAMTGEVEAACRLAGQACALLRVQDPRATQRFNTLLHRLTAPPRSGATVATVPCREVGAGG